MLFSDPPLPPLYQELVKAGRLPFPDHQNQCITVLSDEGTVFICVNLERYELVADAGDVLLFASKELAPKVSEEKLLEQMAVWTERALKVVMERFLSYLATQPRTMVVSYEEGRDRLLNDLGKYVDVEDLCRCEECDEVETCSFYHDEIEDTTEGQETG